MLESVSRELGTVIRAYEIARSPVQCYAARRLKSWLPNKDFYRVRYDLHSSQGDLLYPFFERYNHTGFILDLRCRVGNTGCELRPDAYAEYVGVDISCVPLVKTTARTEQHGRSGNNHCLCSDMLTYVPPHKFNVIVFRDSIYYLPECTAQSRAGPRLGFSQLTRHAGRAALWSPQADHRPHRPELHCNPEVGTKPW
jgi:hypothetical protein